MKRWWVLIPCLALMLRGFMMGGGEPGKALQIFGSLPVYDMGREKPLDSLARNSLKAISGRSALKDEAGEVWGGKSAVAWLAEVMFAPGDAMGRRVFRIDHPDIVQMLADSENAVDRKYFSFRELLAVQETFKGAVKGALAVKSEERSLYQRRILDLKDRVLLFSSLQAWQGRLLVPGTSQDDPSWKTLMDSGVNGAGDGLARCYANMASSYRSPAFGDSVLATKKEISNFSLAGSGSLELLFNRLDPFGTCLELYVLILLLTCLSWIRDTRVLSSMAVKVMGLALIWHTLALIIRMIIHGRPPVTNLYSSAVFVGWAICFLCFYLEMKKSEGLAPFFAGLCGFGSLLLADALSAEGETMEAMRAVLDTNFWLATHVVSITLGYAACFLAGVIGLYSVLRGVLTRSLDQATAKSLYSMCYGVLCFSLIFSFVGTLLGGIWADQSWGRFWGWDPKENGALLIVLFTAAILHARMGGIIGRRGLWLAAIFGNVVTSWSWFGVNMLGVGLHSYGFMEGALWNLAFFDMSQLAVILLGLLPPSRWRSVAAV
ncbi:MAG: cytochrome c biogenesis protein [Planctomycetota bacterium]